MAEPEAHETSEAGALWGLYYAMYHAPVAWIVSDEMPPQVLNAYAKVQDVVERQDAAGLTAITVSESVDPLRYVEANRG